MAKTHSRRWCLLIHTLPARPLYLRARIRRLLAESAAAPIRRAVYALAASDAAFDRLRRIAAEIESGGGSAFVCEAAFPDQEVERVVERACRDELQARYRAWSADATAALRRVSPRGTGSKAPAHSAASGAGAPGRVLDRLRQRIGLLRAVDPFPTSGASQAAVLLAHLERGGAREAAADASALAGLVWVTRRGLHVDRLACAWVVRRFVDPAARFRFVSSPEAPLARGEIGFDMPGAEITHEAGGCSVESLLRRARVRDPAVRRVAEIVHDIDLKDGRFGHAETSGFEQMLLGLIATARRDPERLERGLDLFDTLYAALGRGTIPPAGTTRTVPSVRVPPDLRRRRPRP